MGRPGAGLGCGEGDWLFACDACGAPRLLLARFGTDLFCAACWYAAGRPFPSERLTDLERATLEQNIVNAMAKQKRGNARYMAQAGKA